MSETTDLYGAIFKRKSFHVFMNTGKEKLTKEDLDGIREAFSGFRRLYPDIRVELRVAEASHAGFKKDAEYCLLIYSEKKENYLMNAGYLGEQLDLWLVAHGIGSLWFGFGKPDEPTFDGLDFVIMIAVKRVKESAFRKDMFKAARKPLDEIWSGEGYGAAQIARFSPSACNSQPWFVRNDGGTLTVYRYRKPGKIGLVSPSALLYYNRIDIGIFLCVLELCLTAQGVAFERTLSADPGGEEEMTEAAKYVCAKAEKTEGEDK